MYTFSKKKLAFIRYLSNLTLQTAASFSVTFNWLICVCVKDNDPNRSSTKLSLPSCSVSTSYVQCNTERPPSSRWLFIRVPLCSLLDINSQSSTGFPAWLHTLWLKPQGSQPWSLGFTLSKCYVIYAMFTLLLALVCMLKELPPTAGIM